MKSASIKTCQVFMVFFNFLFFVCGCGLLSIGLWGFIAKDSFSKIISNNPAITNPVLIMIAVGAILIIEGFLGCTGAIRQSKCLLSVFGILTFLLFAAEVATIVVVHVFNPRVKKLIEDSMHQYNTSELVKSVWDSVQSAFQCCGFNGNQDWQGIIPNGTYPHSCCKELPESLNACRRSNPSFFWIGCEASVTGYTSLMNIVVVLAIVMAIEVGGVIFSCCLCHNISKRRYEDY